MSLDQGLSDLQLKDLVEMPGHQLVELTRQMYSMPEGIKHPKGNVLTWWTKNLRISCFGNKCSNINGSWGGKKQNLLRGASDWTFPNFVWANYVQVMAQNRPEDPFKWRQQTCSWEETPRFCTKFRSLKGKILKNLKHHESTLNFGMIWNHLLKELVDLNPIRK